MAPEAMLIKVLMPYRVSFPWTKSRFPSTPESPVSRAAARMPGIMSINTSDSALMARCKGFIFWFASVFKSLKLMFFMLL